VIGTVGRLSFEKDYQTLLEAFALVVKQSPKARLLLIGDGPDRGKLLVLTEQLNLSGSVKFLGMRSDVPALLNALDIFVLSSISEGIPNTILEAMCVGLPVVSTKVGGVPEIVQEGITGLLTRSRDPQSLANALTKLVVSSSLRRKMGDAGKAIVRERFSLESMVKAYEENYVELLSKKKRRMSAASR
jgi:glycosyltransferase involved in cell wall biosynthesis